jgi:ferredoxin-NADP reductase
VLVTLPIRDVLPGTARARLVRLDLQGRHFPYRAGQAVLIAAHGSDKRRPYSIADAPEQAAATGCLELLVGLGDGSTAGPHLMLAPGTLVDVEGPRGRFTIPETSEAQRLLFIAGGTGIAPLRAMFKHALATGRHHIAVLYSARTPDEFAFGPELRDLAATGQIALLMTATRDADPSWRDGRGRIGPEQLASLLDGKEESPDRSTLCFVCGPRSLVDDIPVLLHTLGMARERIRIEEW